MSESRVLRRIFGSKREEVKMEWGKLHIEELNRYRTNVENRVSSQ